LLVSKLRSEGIPAETQSKITDDADGVIFLGGLKNVETIDEALNINREAFQAANLVADKLTENPGVFVTVQDTGGDFGFNAEFNIRPYLGGIAGLTKTAALEWPKSGVKAIDLERKDQTAEALATRIFNELTRGGTAVEVGLKANNERITPQCEAKPAELVQNKVDSNSVLVVSGGARGVTAASLLELSKQTQASFVLLGRTPLEDEPESFKGLTETPAMMKAAMAELIKQGQKPKPQDLKWFVGKINSQREIRQTLADMESLGSKAKYVSGDVRDTATLGKELATVRSEWGPITGIVHGAGVLADALIAKKTQEKFDKVFNTKIEGLQSLLKVTENDPLSVIVLFSSVAARAGNPGQCDYSMANEVLNKVAQREARKRGANCCVKSFNWGPWDSGMVDATLKKMFAERGILTIPLDQGASMFVDELQTDSGTEVEIVIGGGITL
jgi:NAD(P)-dependent dehydrogenase (short-subunit alcohol dehydrogenase family)